MGHVDDYKAPPTSWPKVDALADSHRATLGMGATHYLPILDIVERVLAQKLELFEFKAGSHTNMGMAEGLTCPNGEFIKIREDVYDSACMGGVRARFTVAHELGHFFMHTNVPLQRARGSEKIPAFRSAETQANRYAGTLLMPARLITPQHTVERVMKEFGVSRPAAKYRLSGLKPKGSH